MPVGAGGGVAAARRPLTAWPRLISTASIGSRREEIDRRTAQLLPGLFLARIDGKSPVEYLTEERDKHTVRRDRAIARSHARRIAWPKFAGPGRAKSTSSLTRGKWPKHGSNAVVGRRVWDSRGRPTVEAEIFLDNGAIGRAIAPAGASTGTHEAVELRDGGAEFGGFGVDRAIANVNGEIAAALRSMPIADQSAIDRRLIELDGTPNKARLGGNATIAVSMAALACRCGDTRRTAVARVWPTGGRGHLCRCR